MAMVTVKSISEKIQLALGFFFILEVDEHIYRTFIEPFDVFDEEDFTFGQEEDVSALMQEDVAESTQQQEKQQKEKETETEKEEKEKEEEKETETETEKEKEKGTIQSENANDAVNPQDSPNPQHNLQSQQSPTDNTTPAIAWEQRAKIRATWKAKSRRVVGWYFVLIVLLGWTDVYTKQTLG
ncbi:hypothetical protein RFI_20158 [Reticulomyxa filosa]|uniref:Uncharacterized protein n=1 Tax=Reticulomyxa filosa TaxID=46433 RepID=X6MUP1_RETFI|nr:hypothetical protein RFI_20158 [Reticulomyxa filosa]|eukprot:ETO17172.1 hypothetical protein RFI_20158 [Reticulomyxa filosa]